MPTVTEKRMKRTWDESFAAQISSQAYNTAPVEAVIRNIAYYLRDQNPGRMAKMHFLEMGCGAGPNLVWLSNKGIRVSGVDISSVALSLARKGLKGRRIGKIVEASVTNVPFKDESLDGVIEACVFQHLNHQDRVKAFTEVARVLKPGGVFVGYLLDQGHAVFQRHRAAQLKEDPGTLILQDGSSKFHLTNIGLSHFYAKDEFSRLLRGFKVVDPCLTSYYIPRQEALKRGYEEYLQSMWTVYAIK